MDSNGVQWFLFILKPFKTHLSAYLFCWDNLTRPDAGMAKYLCQTQQEIYLGRRRDAGDTNHIFVQILEAEPTNRCAKPQQGFPTGASRDYWDGFNGF